MPPIKAAKIPIHIHAPFLDAETDILLSALSQNGASATVHQCIAHVLSVLQIRSIAGVRSVSLYLDHMDGVAYTKGSEFDDAHKEIHMSTKYFASLVPPIATATTAVSNMTLASPTPVPSHPSLQSRVPDGDSQKVRYEVLGVLTHELVHCFQYNARGTMPGGLIEGIADYVRLKAHLAPTHWRKGGDRWDEGYAVTAYFLDWCDVKFGDGKGSFVCILNESHREQTWKDDWFETYTGHAVQALWQMYSKTWKES